jgi:hypothetical protein
MFFNNNGKQFLKNYSQGLNFIIKKRAVIKNRSIIYKFGKSVRSNLKKTRTKNNKKSTNKLFDAFFFRDLMKFEIILLSFFFQNQVISMVSKKFNIQNNHKFSIHRNNAAS